MATCGQHVFHWNDCDPCRHADLLDQHARAAEASARRREHDRESDRVRERAAAKDELLRRLDPDHVPASSPLLPAPLVGLLWRFCVVVAGLAAFAVVVGAAVVYAPAAFALATLVLVARKLTGKQPEWVPTGSFGSLWFKLAAVSAVSAVMFVWSLVQGEMSGTAAWLGMIAAAGLAVKVRAPKA